MSRAKVSEGEALTFTAPVGGTISGRGYLIGDIFVIATTAVAAGQPFTCTPVGEHRHAKTAAQAVAEGAALYWDNTNFLVTTTVASNKKIGHASAAALAADTIVRVRLQPL
jgi:predicted RecA/RadA family phage recombinase